MLTNEISNTKNKTVITGTANADDITNYGNNVTVNALGGDDTVRNGIYYVDGGDSSGGDNVSIDGGDGNDLLSNSGGDNITIIGGAGNDSISNSQSFIFLNGERTHNWPNNELIDAGAGDDVITTYGTNVTVNAQGGNDSIRNWENKATLTGGAGNDYIRNGGTFDAGGYMKFGGDEVSISGDDGDDTIDNDGSNVSISGGTGNDSIRNYGDNVTINAGAGNDFIHMSDDIDWNEETQTWDSVSWPDNMTINGGAGDDTIYSGAGANLSIDAGAGNDIIYNNGYKTVIEGGDGDDTIENYGNDLLVTYADGDGNDKIFGFNETSTLSIDGDFSTKKSGKNIIVTVGKGKITLDGAATLETLNIISNSDTTPADSTTLVLTNSDKSPVTLESGVEIVDASARTKAIKIFGNDLDNTIISGQKNDTLSGGGGNDLFVYTAGKDVIADYEVGDKILLGSYDNASVKGDDVVFTVGKGSLTVKDAADKIITFDDGTTFGGGGEESSTTLVLTNSDKSPVTIGANVEIVDASQRTKAIKIFGNDLDNTIISGQKNDTLSGGGGNDLFVYIAGKDVIADYEVGDKISLSSYDKASVKGDDVVFTIGKGSLTVKDAADKIITFDDGTTYGGGEDTTPADSKTLTLTNSDKSPVTIGAAVETVDASARTKAIKIAGNALANSIVGGSKNDSLFGAAGDDTLYGGAGNDTLIGGAGNDVFIYTAGKDVITDYSSGDKISLGSYDKASIKGSDIVFTIGKGTLTVKDSATQVITFTDGTTYGNDSGGGGSDSDTIVLTNKDKSPYTADSTVKIIDASKRTKAIKIFGNSLANSIVGSSKNDSIVGVDGKDTLQGGAGKDTLVGGLDNDSLWGNEGNDTFIYEDGDGKDVIFGFEDGDLLQITGDFSAKFNQSKNEIAFKVGSTTNAITLKEFDATTFNINGDSYQISGTKLVKK